MSNVDLSNAAKTNEDACWDDYVAWLEAEPPAPHPDELMMRYLDHLVASRVPPLRIATVIDAIVDRLYADPREWRHIFNNLYQSSTPAYSTQPNEFLTRVAGRIGPGAALDISMGQGRNSIFLAARGWTVTGFDIAELGIAAARSQALNAGLEIQTIWSSEQAFPYRNEGWDLIVATYCPLPLKSSRFVSSVKRSLRPGGLLLVESFARNSRMGPRRMNVEVAAADLMSAFGDFEVLHQEETTGVADWSRTESSLVRFLARRPARTQGFESDDHSCRRAGQGTTP